MLGNLPFMKLRILGYLEKAEFCLNYMVSALILKCRCSKRDIFYYFRGSLLSIVNEKQSFADE